MPYLGPVDAKQAIEGARLIQANARRLAADARHLLSIERFAGAAMLAATAIEEMARVAYPLELVTLGRRHEFNDSWRRFRNGFHSFPWSVLRDGPGPMEDGALDEMLSFIRRMGTKVDCIEPGLWIDPSELVSGALAQEIVRMAELLCGNQVEPRSLEIWLEVAETLPRNASTKFAMRRYQARLTAEGLALEAEMVAAISARYDRTRGSSLRATT